MLRICEPQGTRRNLQLNLDLLPHQADFVEDCATRSLALVGGYGAGKTKALACKLIILSLQNAGHEGIALSPTYGMSQKVLIPEIEAQLQQYGFRQITYGEPRKSEFRFNKSDFVFYIGCGRGHITKLHVLAAESYKRAAGINAAFFGIDECDLIQPELARAAWRMLSSRLRKGTVFQGVAVSTPEGRGFMYEFWVKEVEEDPSLATNRRIIHADSEDNPFLPPEYIEELRRQFPPHLLDAYLRGQFVNMVGSPVYASYEEAANDTVLTWDELHKDIPLHCGIDFNYNAMSCTVAYVAQNKAFVIDELMGHKNTKALIAAIKERYGQNREIYVYPDASGVADKTSASESDIVQLAAAGFNVFAPRAKDGGNGANPRVKNRINAVNARFCNGSGVRSLFVNRRTCKTLVKALLRQTYKPDGSPVKDGVVDGPVDALGYFVYYVWPVGSKNSFEQARLAA